MKLSRLSTIVSTLTIATTLNLLSVAQPTVAATVKLIGLTDNNTLLSFDPSRPNRTTSIGVSGLQGGNLVGIDFRPANGDLFGVTDTNSVFTIDPTTGIATLVSNNPTPFTLNGNSFGVDFNPNPDRIRVVSDARQNLRLNPNTGGIAINPNGTPAVDGTLTYDSMDANANAIPNIVAEAYTNSVPPSPDTTRRTTLYGIDSNLDVLVTQGSPNFLANDPATPVSPNSGRLFTVGSLGTGIDFGPQGGFDIFSTRNGATFTNTAFAASGSTLYGIDLQGGGATTLGTIGDGNANVIGLAATSVPEPGTISALVGFGALALARKGLRKQG